MLKTYHLDTSNDNSNQLNIAECSDNHYIILSITDKENDHSTAITLDYDQFNDLCGLRYSLDLVEQEANEPESTELALCAA